MSAAPPVVRAVDYRDEAHRTALVALLQAYARDPMGGGVPLPDDVRSRLCDDLAALPAAASFIAWQGDAAVGLANTFESYSTFKARPLLNVHDLVVLPAHRARGVGQALLSACEAHARARGCCKLTLEVLSGNQRALRSYQRFGFAPYVLDPAEGEAVLMQKWL
ncbi:GNAT family N-acetyltransferase [Ottowia sp.]|uniref:GNAT family N-acetyltransferase n=1 Tax=Ottowia sp. TaxID=1898956 RepID=UPI002C7C5435|nr:GNAT family N-acetyltransferase [Ottowia sp.]HOB67564.1 GNAT family N-acetyltransferase [Ottowia sp.]HPZ57226.1 GNAT family N-acetyltransferase [Ottowia sp.]HQD47589.1 GNAT family N-acetyltransferase [Ottowia sp.]